MNHTVGSEGSSQSDVVEVQIAPRPSDETLAAMREADEMIASDALRFASLHEMFESLESPR